MIDVGSLNSIEKIRKEEYCVLLRNFISTHNIEGMSRKLVKLINLDYKNIGFSRKSEYMAMFGSFVGAFYSEMNK